MKLFNVFCSVRAENVKQLLLQKEIVANKRKALSKGLYNSVLKSQIDISGFMRQLLILWLILIFPFLGTSQNCGLDAILPINANSLHSYEIEITDVFNDDLSAPDQGLCGVEINFVHQFVENLELWLVAPSGQIVQLIGPNSDDQLAFTFAANWDIQFIPCTETAEPDPGFMAQWSNNQINNFVAGGQYSGSYYPLLGCLEDFNQGPANGTWTINIANNPSDPYAGAILDFRLIFCDSRGLECCFADAGNLPDTLDVLTCVGDSSLILDFEPIFNNDSPDTSEYSYVYAVGQDGLLIEYDSTLDFTTFPVGTFQICGLSYKKEDRDSFPVPDGIITIDSIRNSLNSFEPFFCGQLTDSCINIQILPIPASSTLQDTICAGDSYTLGDSTFTTTGNYPVILPSFANCDSTVNLQLTVLDIPIINLVETICEGESFLIGDSNYTQTGLYADTLNNFFGCDSIINLDLTVLAPVETTLNETICQGSSFSVGDTTISIAGIHIITLPSAQNCDSIITLNLSVLNPQAIIQGLDTIDCFNPELSLDATTSTPSGLLDFEWTTLAGGILGTTPTLLVDNEDSYILNVTQTENGTSCTASDTLLVIEDLDAPDAEAGNPDRLDCANPELVLDGSGSTQNDSVIYNWSTDVGSFTTSVTILNPSINAAGIYTLEVTDTTNGCSSTDFVEITVDSTFPSPLIEAIGELNCTNTTMILDASGSTGNALNYTWAGPCVISGAVPESIQINCPGTYYLTITDGINSCPAVDSITITADEIAPIADAGPADTLNCSTTILNLDGTASSGDNLIYSWTGPGILSGANTPNPEIDIAGTYQLIVTNSVSTCTDTAEVLIAIDTLRPIAELLAIDSITCAEPFLEIESSTISTGPNFEYEWFTQEGNIIGPLDASSTTVDSAGVYGIRVSNLNNGCDTVSLIAIVADTLGPFTTAGLDQEITCGSSTVFLDGSGSASGPFIEYNWQGDCFLSTPDSLIVEIDCPGTFTLIGTNTQSGCVDSSSVEVTVNEQAPIAILPSTALISCATGTTILDASGSMNGNLIWFLEDMPISLTGTMPEITTPGTYTLVVENPGLNCSDTAVAIVSLDCQPQVIIATPGQLTCDSTSILLDATGSSTGTGFTYQWNTNDPTCILNGADSPTPLIRCPGEYTLVITNTAVQISDSVTVVVEQDLNSPTADAGPTDTLTCTNTIALLDGSGSSNSNPVSYLWTNLNGDTIAQEVSTNIMESDIYLLEVTDLITGCSDISSVNISQDFVVPDISFGTNLIACEADSALIEAFVDPVGDYTYSWSGAGIIGTTDSLSLLIGQEGEYILEIFNNRNDCVISDTIQVLRQSCGPCVLTSTPDTLTCNILSVELQGEVCEPCDNCLVDWTTDTGTIDTQNGFTAEVSAPGLYVLTVTDLEGFSTITEVEVIQDVALPNADAGPDIDITCVDTVLILGGPSSSMGQQFDYLWTSPTSTINTPNNLPTLEVSTEGTYVLEVTNTLTGCNSTDEVMVGRNEVVPSADAGPDQAITCDASLITLDGSASTLGPTILYNWTIANSDCIEDGAGSINPIVSCAGVYTLTVTDSTNGCFATATTSVSLIGQGPILPNIPDTMLTCGVSMIDLTLPIPDTDELSFRWCLLDEMDEPILPCIENTLFVQIDTPGSYLLEVEENATGCQSAQVVNVSENIQEPTLELSQPLGFLNCNTDSLLLSAAAGPNLGDLIIEWTAENASPIENPNTLNPTIFVEDIYTIRVTDVHTACFATATIQVIENEDRPEVNAGIGGLINCETPNLELNATVSTESGQYEVYWTTQGGAIQSGDSTLSPIITQSGIYYINVFDPVNTCSNSDSVSITENFEPPSIQIDASANGILNCEEDIITLDASASTLGTLGAPQFLWSINPVGNISGGNVASPVIEVDEVGFYQLILSDPINGCKDTTIVQVSGDFAVPELSIQEPDAITCSQLEVLLTAEVNTPDSGYTVEWIAPDGTVLSDTSLTPMVNLPGEYILNVTNQSNFCGATSSAIVPINQTEPTASIEEPDILDCIISTVTLDGSNSFGIGALNYFWTSAVGIELPEPNTSITSTNSPGWYYLSVEDDFNGCVGIDSVEVIAEAIPIQDAFFSISSPDCIGDRNGIVQIDSITGGTAPFSYSLNTDFFTTNNTFEFLSAGVYELQIQDSNGCSYEASVTVPAVEEITVDLGVDIKIQLGDSTLLQAFVNVPNYESLNWSPADAFDCLDCPEQWVAPELTSTYAVEVVDSNGCKAIDYITIQVQKERAIFIPTAFSPNGDGNNDVFMIFGGADVKEIRSFQIFDRWGNLVFGREAFQANDPSYGWDGNFQGTPMNAAVFVFYAEVEFVDGKIEFIKGDVSLMR